MSAETDLDAMAAALRALNGAELEARIAKRAAPLLEAALRGTTGRGETPEGRAWAPRKRGGGVPYEHAPERITAKALGPIVRVTLTGPEVYGHFGSERLPKREMIPDAGAALPDVVTRALEQAAAEEFAAATGGGR